VLARSLDYSEDCLFVEEGVLAHLAHAGVTAKVTASSGPGIFTDQQVALRPAPKTLFLITAQRNLLLSPPGKLLASYDPLNAGERAEWLDDYTEARSRLIADHEAALRTMLYSPFLYGQLASRTNDPVVLHDVHDLIRLGYRGEPFFLWQVAT
jgi:hypothetical protein